MYRHLAKNVFLPVGDVAQKYGYGSFCCFPEVCGKPGNDRFWPNYEVYVSDSP